ncbi:MAG: hypothetical protein JOY95_00765 [Silvibacterium sp.]|nr:hypothetical protein [Silvibacterium sp.]
MFVDINKFSNKLGYDYKLLGVVSGEVFESSDLSLQVTTSYRGNVAANSDVSVVVPAEEVKAILYSSELEKLRNDAVAASLSAPKH